MNRFADLLRALEQLEEDLLLQPMMAEEMKTSFDVMYKAKEIALKPLKDALRDDLDKMFAKAMVDAKTDIDD